MTRSGPQGQDRVPEDQARTPPPRRDQQPAEALPWRVAEAVAAFGVALACFWIGRNLSLDWTDEGHIIYPIWRASEGALPYVDVRQLYAPSLFFLNGALLRWFGADLSVIRISLVVLKAGLAALVYLNARLLASRRFALLAYALFVIVWMTPWWVFNTPYANHYGLVCALAAIFGFVQLRRRYALACAWAGLCCGLGATFKQTSGLFTFLAFALFLLWDSDTPDERPRDGVPRWLDGLARALRWATLFAAMALCVAYLAPRNALWNAALLLAPIAAAILFVARRELHDMHPAARLRGALGVLHTGLAMAVPLAAYGIYYAGRGHLGALLADTVSELPGRTNWFDPLPVPSLRSTALTVAMLSFLAAARLAAWRSDGRRRGRAALAWLGLGVVSLAAVVIHAAGAVGLGEYVRLSLWYQDVFGTLYLLPFAVAWVSLWLYVAAPRSGLQRRDDGDSAAALGLWSFFSAISILLLYPAGDIWHLLMSLPAFLPLFAHLLERYASLPTGEARSPTDLRASRPRSQGWLPTIAAVGLVSALCVPFVGTLRFVRAVSAGVRGHFARAPGIVGWPPKFGEAADLVDYLAAQSAETRLLVLCDEQMLYFLAGRRSVMERDEFALYLVGAGVIEPDDRRALVDEQGMIARLDEARPLVIDCADNPRAARFTQAFPQAGNFLATHFRTVASFGEYRVLAWTAG